MQPEIILTDAALHYIKQKLQQEHGVGFRISIKKTGCSGYSYLPSIIEQAQPDDVCVQIDGIQVFLDQKWMDLLHDLKIDFIVENKLGLQQKRLVFSNPKESGRCGCGESFHVE